MKRSLEIITIAVFAVLGVTTLLGIAAQQQEDQDQPLFRIFHKLTNDEELLKKEASRINEKKLNTAVFHVSQDTEELRKQAKLLQNTSTPIKVRGGSMTAFTDDDWRTQGMAAGQFCSLVTNPDVLKFDGDLIPNATAAWTIKIYGTIPKDHGVLGQNRGDPSSQGIQLTASSGGCPSMPGSYHTTLQFLGNGDKYRLHLKPHLHKKENIRFFDTSRECGGDLKPTGEGDRDLCERMSKVVFTFGTATTEETCEDGDCELTVGKAIP